MDVLTIKNLKLKRNDAIACVKRNLKRYAYLKLYPMNYLERLQSFSSSLIKVDKDKTMNTKDVHMLQELEHEEEDYQLIIKYDYLLSSLLPENSSNLFRIYFEGERIVAIREENQNIFKIVNKSYEMLAVLDDDIDYTIDDYATYLKYEQSIRNRGGWNVKKEALAYLESYQNGLYKNEIDLVLNRIPKKEKELLMDYIENGNQRNYTSYEYRSIRRGLLIFAYYYYRIDFKHEDLLREIKKTGGGWEKVINNCRKLRNGE